MRSGRMREILLPSKTTRSRTLLKSTDKRHQQESKSVKYIKSRPHTRSQSKKYIENCPRPHRKAASTNRYRFRYLQTGNPSRLEENDIRRALNASLEDSTHTLAINKPQHKTAMTESSSRMGNSVTRIATRSTTRSKGDMRSPTTVSAGHVMTNRAIKQECNMMYNNKSGQLRQNNIRSDSISSNNSSNNNTCLASNISDANASNNQVLSVSIQSRYRPVAKKQIFQEADFFHEGIMEYIEYALLIAQRT